MFTENLSKTKKILVGIALLVITALLIQRWRFNKKIKSLEAELEELSKLEKELAPSIEKAESLKAIKVQLDIIKKLSKELEKTSIKNEKED